MVFGVSKGRAAASFVELEGLQTLRPAKSASPERAANSTDGDDDDDAGLTLFRSVRKYSRVAAWTVALSSAIALTGFDISIVSNVSSLPEFQKRFGERNPSFDATDSASLEFILPALWLALWNSFVPLGAIFGSLASGPLLDRLGRRPLMMVSSAASVVFATVCFLADLAPGLDAPRGIFLAGKLGTGAANGMLLVGAETWYSEMLPARGPLRGAGLALFPAMTLVGQLVGAVVVQIALGATSSGAKSTTTGDVVAVNATQYRACLAAQWPVALLVLAVALRMPESWVWLLQRGRVADARMAWRRLQTPPRKQQKKEVGVQGARGGAKWMRWTGLRNLSAASSPAADAPAPPPPPAVVVAAVASGSTSSFDAVHAAVMQEKARARTQHDSSNGAQSYTALLRPGPDRRRTLVVCLAMMLPILFGLPLYASAGYFLQTIGMAAAASVAFTIVGVVVGLASNVAAFWTLAKWGRRRLILSSMAVAAVGWLSVGVAGCFKGAAVTWYVGITLMLTLLVLGLGAWPASYVVAAETSSLILRARTQGLAGSATNLVTGVVAVVLPYLYNPDQGNIGARVGFVFAAFCALACYLVWRFVPELKDRDPAEVDDMFEMGLDAREFETWRGGAKGARGRGTDAGGGGEEAAWAQSDGGEHSRDVSMTRTPHRVAEL